MKNFTQWHGDNTWKNDPMYEYIIWIDSLVTSSCWTISKGKGEAIIEFGNIWPLGIGHTTSYSIFFLIPNKPN